MARLAAISKGCFYPTGERIIDLIADAVKVSLPLGTDPGACRLLDPCAGDGIAARLAEKWGLESYGIEIQGERAARSAKAMTAALHGSYHQLDAPKGAFSVLFLNPPYDDGAVLEYAKSVRQEVQFLADTADFLAAHGLLILIIPERVLKHSGLQYQMTSKFYGVEIHRFPRPEVEAFGQVVVIARRKAPTAQSSYAYGYSYTSREADHILGERVYNTSQYDASAKTIILPSFEEKFRFKLVGINPYERAPGVTGGCFKTPKWKMLTGENDLCVFERPLVEPRSGHVAMLLAAGSVNGTEIAGQKLVKGSSEKIVVEGIDEDAGVAFKRERIVSRLSVLDLKTGDTENWRVDEKPEETKAWFAKHGATLANSVLRDHTPIYDGALDCLDFSKLTAPGTLPGFKKPTILDAQKRAVAATVKCWKTRKSVVISGEMGVGKTTCAVAAATLAKFAKVIVVMPTHLVKKWLREVDAITGKKGTARTATKLSDVDAFFNDPRAKFLVLSKERAKLGAKWEPAFARRRTKVTREERVEDEDDEQSWRAAPPRIETVTTVENVPACPACGAVIVHRDGTGFVSEATLLEWLAKAKRACASCESPLWQACAISERGTTRWPLAAYVNDRFSHRYALIVDECFPGRTLIATDAGLIPIRDVLPGTLVRSWRNGHEVLRRVVRNIKVARAKPLVKIVHECGELVCTADHKIWVRGRGYVRAGLLVNTDVLILTMHDANQSLPRLQKDVQLRTPNAPRSEDVQPEVWGQAPRSDDAAGAPAHNVLGHLPNVRQDRDRASGATETALLFPTMYPTRGVDGERQTTASHFAPHVADERAASDEKGGITPNAQAQSRSGRPREDGIDALRAHVSESGRQREPAPGPARDASSGVGDGLANRAQHPNREPKVAWRGSGPREPAAAVGDRSGRSESSHQTTAHARPHEREDAPKTQVDCVACEECGSDVGPSGRAQAHTSRVRYVEPTVLTDEYVYDLEVEDTHNYFADGVLVSNCHQYAHASSDQSRAVQLLAAGATKLLAMTGTLYGGRASSIFHLLYKVDPRFRDLYEYTDSPRFVHDHGLLETVTKLEEYTSTYGNRRNNSGGRVREIPGVNPAMLNLLLGYTVFLKLSDLGYKLPPFEETVELIDHDDEVLAASKAMAATVKQVLREHPKILSQYLMACLGYPDCPEHAESIMSVPGNRWDKPEELASAPAFPEQRWPKDAAVVRIAKREKKLGLKTLVFFTQTGKRTPIPRVKKFLEAAKLKVAVLDGSITPEKREEWLAEHGDDFDVLLTNGRLVETGLDLLFATTIVQYGIEYSIPTLRQSTRRSWRLGQTRAVKVIYLAYRGTMQEIAMQLIAKKMRAAELVDGDDLGGLAQHDVGGHDFLLALAREAAELAV